MKDQRKEGYGWLLMAGQMLLAGSKGLLGLFGGSQAMLADAAQTAAGSVHTAVSSAGFRRIGPLYASRPYEREKMHKVASIISSIVIIVLGLEIGLHAAQQLFRGEGPEAPEWYVPLFMTVLFAIRILFALRRQHHDRSKAGAIRKAGWPSQEWVPAITLVGVSLAYAGERSGTYALLYADGVGALLAGLLMIWSGYLTISASVRGSASALLRKEEAGDFTETAQRISGVIAVEHLEAREQGHYVVVDIRISVSPGITVAEGQEIGKIVKFHLMKKHAHITDVLVRVTPYESGYPYKRSTDMHSEPLMTLLQ
ncbi:hypothetical protein SY83_14025 [Paenibacillus swuensis]|uniref:Uncharacterized protein n=1 Tax=Paenibacillus swuensis TaxID=1178515 RepID=A0A172TJQ5_9BACL|nr:cation diffusion facilitator family transporter [Paenibacillus swuensis]ANE47196.1 hypothetical protein SY83_14025 [Paenibacillus swuensis]